MKTLLSGLLRPALLLTALACGPAALQPTAAQGGLQPIPAYDSPVVDTAALLQPDERARLVARLMDLQTRKGSQVAVLIVPTTQPEEIEQYSIRVADAWKTGRKGVDDGAILLIAQQDRRMRIEVGRGLEGALTDLVSNRVIDETIRPAFRAGEFGAGIEAGVDRVIGVIDGEELPPPDPRWSDGKRKSGGLSGAPLAMVVALALIGGFLLLRSGLGQCILQGCKFFGGGHVNHRLLRSSCRSSGSLRPRFCDKYVAPPDSTPAAQATRS